MEQNYQQQPPPGYQQNYAQPGFQPMQQDLQGSTGILVMGILSIVFAGLIGLILAIIALSQSGKAIAEYKSNPAAYTASSYSKVKAGRICAIIGLCILGFVILMLILFVGILS
jgi:uncharacterized membrane protein YidH (DUF202 family)